MRAFYAVLVCALSLQLLGWLAQNGFAFSGHCSNHFGEGYDCTIIDAMLGILSPFAIPVYLAAFVVFSLLFKLGAKLNPDHAEEAEKVEIKPKRFSPSAVFFLLFLNLMLYYSIPTMETLYNNTINRSWIALAFLIFNAAIFGIYYGIFYVLRQFFPASGTSDPEETRRRDEVVSLLLKVLKWGIGLYIAGGILFSLLT